MEDQNLRELREEIELLKAELAALGRRPRSRLRRLLARVPSSRRAHIALVAAGLAVATVSYAATISMPYTFSNGTIADADEVNANFAALVAESNDQHLRLTATENQTVTNVADIGNNASGIAANVTNIGTNALGIAANASAIAGNSSDIAANASAIADNASDIAANASGIAANAADIAGFPDELKNLTVAEVQQLENIETAAISATEWGHVASMQAVSTTSNPTFASLAAGEMNLAESTVSTSTPISTEMTTTSNSWVHLATCDIGDQDTDRQVFMRVRVHTKTSTMNRHTLFIVRGVAFSPEGGANYVEEIKTGAPILGYTEMPWTTYQYKYLSLGPYNLKDNDRMRFWIYWRQRETATSYVDNVQCQVQDTQINF